MVDSHKDLEELEALVAENRSAFIRAKRLLSAMKERSQGEPKPQPVQEDAATLPDGSGGAEAKAELSGANGWLDLEHLARVELGAGELASDFMASALAHDSGKTWRPEQPGPQTIRLRFDAPQSLRRVQVEFVERELERTQEFALRWLPQGASQWRDIVRQQYVFSPAGSTRELEEYRVDLREVVGIELCIVPDLRGGAAFATLTHWRLAPSDLGQERARV